MKHKGTKVIETERLLFRHFQMNDAEVMFKNRQSDSKVTEFLCWKTAASVNETKQILSKWVQEYEKTDFYQGAIVLKEIEEPIDFISVVGKNEHFNMLHIGYCIGSKWWHQGITSEAFKAIIPFFFEEVGVNRMNHNMTQIIQIQGW